MKRVCAFVSFVLLASSANAADAPALLATYRLTAGWATFGLVLPQGAASQSVQVGSLPTQTDVKTTWPDGSIRFAVVTTQAATAAEYAVTTASSGPARQTRILAPAASWPRVSVRLTIRDRVWTAKLPTASADDWLNGQLVREGRVLVTPVDDSGQRHPFLRVLADVRAYAGGGHRVDLTVENTLDVAAADQVTYDVDVAINDASVFTRSGVVHAYLTRWRRVFAADVRLAEVTPDFRPFIAAGAVPQYMTTVADNNYRVDAPQFDILQFGDIHLPMNDVGGRPEIAPYPNWTAQYLVHRRPGQLAYMLAHGDLAGSAGIHIKEPDGVRLVSIDAHPNYWLDTRAEPENRPKNNLRGRAPKADNAHQPSLAYVPYLVTGDRYYADEMKYWANFCLLDTWQDEYYNKRHGREGLLVFDNDVRGIGWALRNMGDTVYLPDVDPERTYLLDKVQNNLAWLQNHAETFHTPFGTLFPGYRPEDKEKPPYTWIALWEHDYVAWTLDHLLGHGLSAGTGVRDHVARFQLRLFSSEAEGYGRVYGAPYRLAMGTRTGDSYTYFTTMRQVFDASFGNPPEAPKPLTGYWGPEARLMLLIALDQGWTGAREAYDYLMSYVAPDRSTMAHDLAERSGWAIARPGDLALHGTGATGRAKDTAVINASAAPKATRNR